jgi:chromate transporter
MTMHCGHERAGWKGLFVAGICFIFPAVVLSACLAYLYVEYGTLPEIEPFLYGIKPAVLAIILSAILKLGKKALKNWQLGIIGALAIMGSLGGVNEITVILAAGVIGLLWLGTSGAMSRKAGGFGPAFFIFGGGGTAILSAVSNSKMFLVFLKIGAILFGSGYVLVAYLDAELVEKLGWLTRPELLDAIAIGQFTPGPVLSTATFVGYQINGLTGALAATLGIFLPSFFFVWLLNPIVPKLRKSPWASAFLDAVNIGAVGIMIGVTYRLGEGILTGWESWLIALCAIAATLLSTKVSALYLVLGGSALGYLLFLMG